MLWMSDLLTIYCWAKPLMHLYNREASLNWRRTDTGKNLRCWSVGVICLNFSLPDKILASMFWTYWRLAMFPYLCLPKPKNNRIIYWKHLHSQYTLRKGSPTVGVFHSSRLRRVFKKDTRPWWVIYETGGLYVSRTNNWFLYKSE